MKKIVLMAAVLALSASLASAYSLNGRKWFSSSDATFRFNNSNGATCCLSASAQSSAIQSGLNAWAILSNGGSTNLSGAKRDGVNVVSWGKLGGTTLGVTNYIATDSSQSQVCGNNLIYRFQEVDVRFNNAFNWQTSSTCTNGFDLSGVSVHEFGHAVGLGHSSVPGATMYPSVAACDFSVSSLANDDKAGYSAIYSGCR
ncbi:MAG TPA: matrixin family metalloprotease [Thermoanaerobaculia bacterium]|nr:matrixin family metalloprotease [Thermoanaerobaculia bacterium]